MWENPVFFHIKSKGENLIDLFNQREMHGKLHIFMKQKGTVTVILLLYILLHSSEQIR